MEIGRGIGTGVFILCVLTLIIVWGGWELTDWLFIDETIESTTPITPEIKLIIDDNEVDTIYIYRQQ